MSFDTKRLYSALLNTGLQNKDPALYQVIYQLIGALIGAQTSITTLTGSIISDEATTEITNIIQIVSNNRSESSPNRIIPGPRGDAGIPGAAGATGATLPGPLGIIKHYIESYPKYVPMMGNQGNPGITGAQGPIGPVIRSKYLEVIKRPIQIIQGSSSSGKLIQVVNTQTGATATGTTVLPFDDTVPQNTEGDEYISLAITPTSAANKLKIEVVIFVTSSGGSNWITAALFQDAVANALASQPTFQITAGGSTPIVFTHYMTAGTTSSTTFKVRAGGLAGTTRINGSGAARVLGGVMASSITISEIVP